MLELDRIKKTTLDESNEIYTDLRGTQAGLKYLYDGISLKVSGIIPSKSTARKDPAVALRSE